MAEWTIAPVLSRDGGMAAKRDPVSAKGGSREKPGFNTMHDVYVLYSAASKRLYIGSSATPDKRLQAHNAGRGGWTKSFRPWLRVLLEEFPDKQTAVKREHYLKSGWGRKWLTKHILSEGWQSGRLRRS